MRKLMASDRIELALRIADGPAVPGLRPKWRHGSARVEPGGLLFASSFLQVFVCDARSPRQLSFG